MKTGRLAFRLALAGLVTALAVSLWPGPAASQGIFELLFGNLRRAVPQMARPFADPGQEPDEEAPLQDYSPPATYCVRTCDGHFFPVTRTGSASPGELCKSFCPASETKIYSGGGIAHAVASDGKRYTDLPNAYLYRDRIVEGCTCNGKDAFGLKRLDAKSDPTLQAGDILATPEGLMAYRRSRRGIASFTPVNPATVYGGRKISSYQVQGR